MRRATTIGAVAGALGVAGAAQAFILVQVAIPANGYIAPAAGGFWTQYPGDENHFLMKRSVVNRDYDTWNPGTGGLRSVVDDTTYFAIDPQSPGGFQGLSDTGPLGEPANPAPKWTNVLTGTDSGLVNATNGYAPAIVGGSAGLSWIPDEPTFEAQSEPTTINGTVQDSLFIGQFIVTDPDVPLVGTDLLVTLETSPGVYEDKYVPLNGSYYTNKSAGQPFQLNFEREPAGPNAPAGAQRVLMYLQPAPVPGPGTIGMGAMVAFGLARRRR